MPLNPWKIVIIKGQKRNELGVNVLEPEFKKIIPKLIKMKFFLKEIDF